MMRSGVAFTRPGAVASDTSLPSLPENTALSPAGIRSDQPSIDALVPGSADTVWTIESGTYAGLRVPLSVNAALGRRRGEHFWRLAAGSEMAVRVVGWKSSRYPIAVAFRHTGHAGRISSADSSAFWSIVGQMNADFGMELFRPATIGEDDPPDVIVVDLGLMREADGLSRVTWAPSGELFDVRLTFQDASVLHEAHVVTHEMMHALGFGHTTGWRSVVNRRDRSGAERVTPIDVAYAQMAMHSRIARERADTRLLIALAVSRETSGNGIDQRNAPCDESTSENGPETSMRIHGLVPLGLLTVVSACSSGDKNRNGPDTIAVPAAAVDTTTDRVPGETPRAESHPATGVDTPITRKIGAPAPARKKGY